MDNSQEQELSTSSPVPPQEESNIPQGLDFFDALKAVAAGKRITKLEWANDRIYGILTDSRLKLMLPAQGTDTYTLKDWTITDGDLGGIDWVVLE